MKRKNTQLILLASFAAFTCGSASAAEKAESGEAREKDSKVEFIKTANHPDVVEILDGKREHDPQDIPVPHFAIHTKDNAFIMSIGGQINPIIGGDFRNDLYEQDGAGINFVTNQIPVPAVSGKKSDAFINALNANVDMEIVGLGGTRDQITGYIKIGTNGINNNIHLKKAYISWRGFTAGQKNTLLKDSKACQPAGIDPQGPPGTVTGTAYEVSYISPSYKGLRGAIGIAMPSYYTSSGIYLGKDYQAWNGHEIEGQVVSDPMAHNQTVPDIPMFVEWAHSDYNRIRVSGLIRNFSYQDVLAGKRRNTIGWGVMLSGNINPVKPLILSIQAIYGKGIGAYIRDLAGLPLSFTPDNSHPGKMTPTPMAGFNFGATWNFNKKWQANVMVSQARLWSIAPYAIEAAEDPGNFNNYKCSFYTAANVFYNISSYFQVGVEYIYGTRTTWNAGSACDNRLQAQFMFTL